MKPGERHFVGSENPIEVRDDFVMPLMEQRWQRQEDFADHLMRYIDQENVRDSPNAVTTHELQTKGWLAATANSPDAAVYLNGVFGHGGHFAFAAEARLNEHTTKTTRIVLSKPYDSFMTMTDNGPRQSTCFALLGHGEGGGTQIVVADVLRDPEMPLDTEISKDELSKAVPRALIHQDGLDLSMTTYSVSCASASDLRPWVDFRHLGKQKNELFLETELPRIVAAMPLR
jgi:hypothetical protein